jgi:hypothetical protein
MDIKAVKRIGLSIAMASAFLVIAGSSSAFAQDGPYRDGYGRIDSRWQEIEYQRGVNDGRIAGKRDALAHLNYNPPGSIRYQQRVGIDYRQGFLKGYAQTYRQFANNYVYRDNNRDDYRYGYRNDQYRQDGYYDRSGNFHRY